ncbi:hypothetical protein [Nocardiopsis coralliicola]
MPEHPPDPPQPAGVGAAPPPAAGGPAARARTTRLFLIVGGAVAAVGAVTLALVLVLTLQSPRYTDLLPCSDVGLSGGEPIDPGPLLEHHPWAPDSRLRVDCSDRVAQAEGETRNVSAVLAEEGYADGDGAMEDLLDRLISSVKLAEEVHGIALGEHTVAYYTEPKGGTGLALVGAVSGNAALVCFASADGAEPDEGIERATELCSEYLDAMDAGAPRS